MTKYTDKQIEECTHNLNYGVKEGYINEDEANQIIKAHDWEYVYEMMDRGDMANDVIMGK